MPDNGELLPKKNRGLIIAVGAGLVLAFLYILTRPRAAAAPEGDGTGVALQNVFNSLSKVINDAIDALREEFEPRLAATETGLEEHETELTGLGERVSTWQDLIEALSLSLTGQEERLGALEETQTGLGASLQESIRAQMVNTGKALFLGMEEGTQSRTRLRQIKRFVISQLQAWGYPEDVIAEFTAWVDPHIVHSSTGVRPEGFTGGAFSFLAPLYGARAPQLMQSPDAPINAPRLAELPIRGRYGKH